MYFKKKWLIYKRKNKNRRVTVLCDHKILCSSNKETGIHSVLRNPLLKCLGIHNSVGNLGTRGMEIAVTEKPNQSQTSTQRFKT